MTDTITLTGILGTEPRRIATASGTTMTSFRLASAQRRYDRNQNVWVEVATNWYTVNVFGSLADNALGSLKRGDRVIVAGRVLIKRWEAAGKSGTDVVVTAESLGHDLVWGTSQYTKTAAVARENLAVVTSAEQEWPGGPTSELSHDWNIGVVGPEAAVAPSAQVSSGEVPF